jgi:hypothetical protein
LGPYGYKDVATGYLDTNTNNSTTRLRPPTIKHPNHNLGTHEDALKFVNDRELVYKEQGWAHQWKMRGIGYLFSHKNMILKGELPTHLRPGRNVIRILNVLEEEENSSSRSSTSSTAGTNNNCHLLTIWVRVNGPEIFAGSAHAVHYPEEDSDDDSRCGWEFEFDLQLPGTYTVDAKVLLWNGGAAGGNTIDTCHVVNESVNETLLARFFPAHQGFQGFKLYDAPAACCEICSRLSPHCKLWRTPALKLPKPSFRVNGCELYFEKGTSADVIPQSHLLN